MGAPDAAKILKKDVNNEIVETVLGETVAHFCTAFAISGPMPSPGMRVTSLFPPEDMGRAEFAWARPIRDDEDSLQLIPNMAVAVVLTRRSSGRKLPLEESCGPRLSSVPQADKDKGSEERGAGAESCQQDGEDSLKMGGDFSPCQRAP